jgi:hypothetical protein
MYGVRHLKKFKIATDGYFQITLRRTPSTTTMLSVVFSLSSTISCHSFSLLLSFAVKIGRATRLIGWLVHCCCLALPLCHSFCCASYRHPLSSSAIRLVFDTHTNTTMDFAFGP